MIIYDVESNNLNIFEHASLFREHFGMFSYKKCSKY